MSNEQSQKDLLIQSIQKELDNSSPKLRNRLKIDKVEPVLTIDKVQKKLKKVNKPFGRL